MRSPARSWSLVACGANVPVLSGHQLSGPQSSAPATAGVIVRLPVLTIAASMSDWRMPASTFAGCSSSTSCDVTRTGTGTVGGSASSRIRSPSSSTSITSGTPSASVSPGGGCFSGADSARPMLRTPNGSTLPRVRAQRVRSSQRGATRLAVAYPSRGTNVMRPSTAPAFTPTMTWLAGGPTTTGPA